MAVAIVFAVLKGIFWPYIIIYNLLNGRYKMDPVNKWIWTVVIFMAALIITIGWKAGAGTYEMVVMPSSLLKDHDIIYILDTKNGEVKARPWDHNEFRGKSAANMNKIFYKWETIKPKNMRRWDHNTQSYRTY